MPSTAVSAEQVGDHDVGPAAMAVDPQQRRLELDGVAAAGLEQAPQLVRDLAALLVGDDVDEVTSDPRRRLMTECAVQPGARVAHRCRCGRRATRRRSSVRPSPRGGRGPAVRSAPAPVLTRPHIRVSESRTMPSVDAEITVTVARDASSTTSISAIAPTGTSAAIDEPDELRPAQLQRLLGAARGRRHRWDEGRHADDRRSDDQRARRPGSPARCCPRRVASRRARGAPAIATNAPASMSSTRRPAGQKSARR